MLMLVTELMIQAEIDANPGILLQDPDLLPLLSSVHVNDIIPETKIQRNDIGTMFIINHGHMTPLAFANDIKDIFLLCDRMTSHKAVY